MIEIDTHDTWTETIPGLDGGDVTVTCRLPASLARRWALAAFGVRVPTTGSVAALGQCWAAPRGSAPAVPWTGDPGAYGEAVGDALMARGAHYFGLMEAGQTCLVRLLTSTQGISEEKVKEAEDFFDPARAR